MMFLIGFVLAIIFAFFEMFIPTRFKYLYGFAAGTFVTLAMVYFKLFNT